MDSKIYDLQALSDMVDGNQQHIKVLVELFVQITPQIVADMRTSAGKADASSLYSHTHKLKPTLEQMGMHKLKPLADSILLSTRAGSVPPKTQDDVHLLCNTLDRAIEQLKLNEL